VDADTRRDALVRAALDSLAANGHEGASVRKIAAIAGVSPGLINHHFATIDELIAQAYEHLAMRLMAQQMAHVNAAANTPAARLVAFFEVSFSPLVLDPQLLTVWLVFWSKLPHSPALLAIHRRTWAHYRGLLAVELAGLARAEDLTGLDADDAATALAAMLDGLWVMWCLDPKALPPNKGLALCQAWLANTLAGARAAKAEASLMLTASK
jgi:TetR/AcrR family transcriptional repressor of bet genes